MGATWNQRVVWALDSPPSQRPLMSPDLVLTGEVVTQTLGHRFVGGWFAYFTKTEPWLLSELHEMSWGEREKVVGRFEFFVAPDVVSKEQLFVQLRSIGEGLTAEKLWRSDRDTLWRAGVSPVMVGQRPKSSMTSWCGDAITSVGRLSA
jgi:hypothetical protein